MQRVVMFTNTFEPMVGGLERSVQQAHHWLNRNGHLCRVVTPVFKGAEDSCDGILRMPALTGFGNKNFSIPLPSTTRIESWMEAIEPHLVHAHQPFLLGDIAWRVSQQRNVPLVFTHHTFYERYAHYLPFDEDQARSMLIGLTTQYANRCHRIIAPTPSVQRQLVERGISVPIDVVPTGIDVQRFGAGDRARGRHLLGLHANDVVIGHLGRLSQEKNLDFLAEVLLRLVAADARIRCLLVGDGDRLDWVKGRFAEQGVADRIITPGVLGHDTHITLADAYAAMDVFVFASHTDTQGLVLAEAMAAGLPIVALDAPGARDCIADRETGRLLPSHSTSDQFAAAVALLMQDAALRQVYSEQARRTARDYDLSRCMQRLLETYVRTRDEHQPEKHAESSQGVQLAERFDVEWTSFWEKLTTAVRALSRQDSSGDA